MQVRYIKHFYLCIFHCNKLFCLQQNNVLRGCSNGGSKNKTCFQQPEDCIKNGKPCDIAVSFRSNKNGVIFQVSGYSNYLFGTVYGGYVFVAISPSRQQQVIYKTSWSALVKGFEAFYPLIFLLNTDFFSGSNFVEFQSYQGFEAAVKLRYCFCINLINYIPILMEGFRFRFKFSSF